LHFDRDQSASGNPSDRRDAETKAVYEKLKQHKGSDELQQGQVEAPARIKGSSGITSGSETLREELRMWRKQKATELGWRAYIIFSNRQLENLVENKPSSLEDLLNICGFGERRVQNFGTDILKIITGGPGGYALFNPSSA